MGLFDALFRRRTPETVRTAPAQTAGKVPVLRVGNLQGVGLREQQEDSFGILRTENGLIAVVADGMGGMAQGKQASEYAVDAFLELARRRQEVSTSQWLLQSVLAVSEQVFQGLNGASGTTFVAVVIEDRQLHWVSVGDSAIYLSRNGGVFQLNQEHTYLNRLYAQELAGDTICKERAERDIDARRLTAFVGMRDLAEVDQSLRPMPLQLGDTLLLCSDGISGVLSGADLMEAMSLEPDEGCGLLETSVLEKKVPEQDNYTGILISYK